MITRLLLLLLCCQPLLSWAAIQFSPLTGRVVDNANLLTPAEEQQLTALLADHEQRTTNQVVVVTLPNLQGYTIEEFGYQLGRHWGVGQKGRNNGVLFIVAQQERGVRIEVGYGLEGILTDANSALIIQRDIVPAFRRGQFGDGIAQGTHAILSALVGEYHSGSGKPDLRREGDISLKFKVLLLICAVLFIVAVMHFDQGGPAINTYQRGIRLRGRTGGFGGGGFRSGGGGFGGGGASGRW